MSRAQTRMPVLSSLVTAHFITGSELVDRDTGLKQTTEAAWGNKYLNAEEIAAIVPIPENVLDDVDYDLWAEIKPNIEEALGAIFDAAVLYGTNAPSSWPTAIVPGALAAGNSVTLAAVGDLYDDIMSEGGVLNKVEEDGYMPSGHVAALSMRGKLRGLRGDDGTPIFTATMTGSGAGAMQGPTRYELDGSPIEFPTNGAVDPAQSLLISGDYKQLVYALRQDITYKLLTEAVIQDNTGAIVYNLAQQDMVALRVVMRIAWQIPNPINRVQSTEADRYPFAVLVP
jgi:HK97 family phage major capsid protein